MAKMNVYEMNYKHGDELITNKQLIDNLLFGVRRVLIISPHCDDAAFSIGGIIYEICQQEIDIIILTCFSKSHYAIKSSEFSIEEITLIRKREDQMFRELCNAKEMQLLYIDLLDAPLRKYRNVESLFDPMLQDNELLLIDTIKNSIRPLLQADTLLLFPMAIGNHIDHVISNIACRTLANSGVYFGEYFDQPYVASKKVVSFDYSREVSPILTYKIERKIKRKIIDCYLSQVYEEERLEMLTFGSEIIKLSHLS